MADDREENKEDKVQEILSGLDQILSGVGPPEPGPSLSNGLGSALPPATQPPPKPPVAAKAPPASPPAKAHPEGGQGARPPASTAPPPPPKAGPPAAASPKPAPVAPAPVAQAPQAAPPAPVPAQPPTAAPAPSVPAPAAQAAASGPAGEEELVDTVPPDAPKSQIRRIGYIYSPRNRREMDAFIRYLDETVGSVSKKPLFTRKVMLAAVDEKTDSAAVVAKLKSLKAVGVLAVVENAKDPKVAELSKACAGAKIMFKVIPPPDVQKRSIVFDLAIDMMLLASEM
ncbi:MAG: hypothetical protein HY748_17320 [Elusimicrobia bacterium]|nr:hypothetical protein [Elusimicrobiota bacterium]